MPRVFNVNSLMPGDDVHVLSVNGKFAKYERRLIGSAGSHDTCVIDSGWLGESTMKPPVAHLTALVDYEAMAERGDVLISVLRIPNLTDEERDAIASAWCLHVKGTFYDFRGIAKLCVKETLLKAIPDDSPFWNRSLGWEWANWCTEGWAKAIREAGKRFPSVAANDPFADKQNPTPRTVENRVRDGRLIDVSSACLTAYGQQFRLVIPEIL